MMTRTIFVATAFALGGCACFKEHISAAGPSFDPKNPKVFVVREDAKDCKGKAAIVVDQEPIYFFGRGKGAVTITWHLQTKGYSFVQEFNIQDPKPVETSALGEISNCQAKGQNMTCTNKNQNRGYWKYTLKIQPDEGCTKPEDLDPLIGND
jgi:hypothetical protein